MACDAQVIDRCSTYFIRIRHRLHANFTCELGHLLAQLCQRLDELSHVFVLGFIRNQSGNEFAKLLQCRALVAQHLASQQIQTLNGIGALVNHIDT